MDQMEYRKNKQSLTKMQLQKFMNQSLKLIYLATVELFAIFVLAAQGQIYTYVLDRQGEKCCATRKATILVPPFHR